MIAARDQTWPTRWHVPAVMKWTWLFESLPVIGKKLIDILINDARTWYDSNGSFIRKLYLLTHEDNINAHIFYEKVGFIHETTLKDHYYKNKDERVYTMFFPRSHK